MHTLQLKWKRREGGNNWTERDYLDVVIDNISLSKGFGDLISCIGWALPSENEKAIRLLLLEEPADFPNNRRSLYVCPECGDLGCGAISIVIEQKENRIIWRNFALEYNYSDDLTEHKDLGPFIFEKTDYEKVLRSAL